MKRPLSSVLPLTLVIFLCACGADRKTAPGSAGADAWLPLKIGEVELEAQIALTQAEQRQGLMHRDSLPENGGMLFPYPTPRRLSFWMANTRIPLDIGFFDQDGILREVHRLIPFDTEATPSRSGDLQYALEMNTGWFARNGLFPGVQLDLELLAEALRQRGADPERFGLAAP